MSKLKFTLCLLVISIGLCAIGWLSFHVWRLKHPTAPPWVFFLSPK